MADSFMPADERRRRALARTTAPGGGYKVAQPVKAGLMSSAAPKASMAQAKQSGAALGERLRTEPYGGMTRGSVKVKRLFSVMNHATGEHE